MPKSRSKKSKLERKIKIPVQSVEYHNLNPPGEGKFGTGSSPATSKEINTLNAIASTFPKIILKMLLYLPPATRKSLRLTSKALKTAVDQYIGLGIMISENHADYDISNKIRILTKDLLNSFKNVGIRCLKGVQLTKTPFFEIINFPYLLQSVSLFGQIDQQILLGLLKECWNLRTLKLQEPNQYQTLIRGNFIDFMCSIANLIEKRKSIRLNNLRTLKIHCSTTSTMGYILVIFSVLEAKCLERLHCCIGPVHVRFHTLITGLIVNVIKTAHTTLEDFWLVVESSVAYPEVTAKRRFLRKLSIFNQDFPETLPKFEEAIGKLYWSDEDQNAWLKDILTSVGRETNKLTKIRLDIDTVDDFVNNWLYFLRNQYSLRTFELQACCNWSFVEDIVKQNAKTLETLGIIMEFLSPMDVEMLMRNCSNLKRLILKNFDFDWTSLEQLEMRQTGHVVNAKFDELFPQLECLALSNLLIRSTDVGRLAKIPTMKDFVFSILETADAGIGDIEPTNMFGLMYDDFKILLHHRNLNHIVISKEAILCGGTLEIESLEAMIENPMFHTTSILDWQLLTLDEEHIAVAHGDNVTMSNWIFPLIMSVVEDTIAADVISFRCLVNDDDDR